MTSPEAEVEIWRRAGRIGAAARELGAGLLRPGAGRRDVAEEVERYIRAQGAEPAFPVNLSINDEAAHYTPAPEDDHRFRAGDLVKVDVGAHLDGHISDTAVTVEIGTSRHGALRQACRDALAAAEGKVRDGVPIETLSAAIETAIHARGLKPVRNLTGHTIEPYLLHAGTSIPNATGMSSGELRAGQVVAIEPFATNGKGEIRNGPFGNIVRFRGPPSPERAPELAELYRRFSTLPFCARWVADEDLREILLRSRRYLQTYPVFVEEGRGMVAQAEHTLWVREDGAEVLTP